MLFFKSFREERRIEAFTFFLFCAIIDSTSKIKYEIEDSNSREIIKFFN